MKDIQRPISIIGAGSWGTALAIYLASLQQTVRLWGRDSQQLQALQQQRENQRYLPGIALPENLEICADFPTAVNGVNDILVVVPSHSFRETLNKLQPHLHAQSRIIWATKGLDPRTHQLLHLVAQDIVGEKIPLAILSGPTFAAEIARGLPAAATIASTSAPFARDLVTRFHSKQFRAYYSQDMIGVQLGGAMKNILAIAAGITDGLQCGANAIAALLTRGMHEMLRLGLAMGAASETFMGLSGLGDLILTCTNNQSRNRRFGLAIGQGNTIDAAKKQINQVVEGILTTKEIYEIAQEKNIELPIIFQVYHVLYENLSPRIALQNLLERQPKAEF